MKKRFLIVLTLVFLLCSGIALSEDAASASYASAQAFLDVCDANDVYYVVHTLEESGEELVRVDSFDFENQITVSFYIYFDAEQGHAYIRTWDLIAFQESDKPAVLEVLNQLNHDYSFLSIFAEDDCTVSAKYDIIFTDSDSAGSICFEAMCRIASILQSAYPSLAPFVQGA